MITVTQVKVLTESTEVSYYSVEGERLVEGSKKMNVGPTPKMLEAINALTSVLARVFYYDGMDKEFLKTKIIATGFKYKQGTSGDSAVITGKLCLESNRWIGISSDAIGFDENAYGITDLEAWVKSLKQSCTKIFFPKPTEQYTIDE